MGLTEVARAKPHVGRPSVLLPESLEAWIRSRFLPLRRRIEPVSPECVHATVWSLSDYGRCAFGSGMTRFSRHVHPSRAVYRLLPAPAVDHRPGKQKTRLAAGSRAEISLVPRRGLEPPRFYPLVPETSASTNSATWANPAACDRGANHTGRACACQRTQDTAGARCLLRQR